MLSDEMTKRLNEQLAAEMFSHNLYLSMAADCKIIGLRGFAKWLLLQANEEMGHALRIFKFISDNGEKVEIQQIMKPTSEWKNPTEMFFDIQIHEKSISASIDELMHYAKEKSDNATEAFLSWFVTEQVEEELTVSTILKKLKINNGDGAGLLAIDRELGTRI